MATITPIQFSAHHLSFDGAILKRGFWVYVYRVTCASETYLYIGRTGDSSSKFAASPFARLGRHLEIGKNAKGNTLSKRLRENGIEPDTCHFELIALGPIYLEQPTTQRHRPYRDAVASLESGLADELKQRGHRVLGLHPKPGQPDLRTLKQLVSEVERWLQTTNGKRGL